MLNETVRWHTFVAYPTLDFSARLKLFTPHFNTDLQEIIRMQPQTGH
jgi:hypothetical protein